MNFQAGRAAQCFASQIADSLQTKLLPSSGEPPVSGSPPGGGASLAGARAL
jgi:hypothetical protein